MNYELAEELKDAEFLFPWHSPDDCSCLTTDGEYRIRAGFCYPTLSELIEACGDNTIKDKGFAGLLIQPAGPLSERWFATNGWGTASGSGATPEEAVANLWLALKDRHE